MKLYRLQQHIKILFVSCFLLSHAAYAEGLKFDITGGHVQPIPLAIAGFHPLDEGSRQVSQNVLQVIQTNFQHDGYFKFIEPHNYPQSASSLLARKLFSSWRKIDCQAIVYGTTQTQSDGRIRIQYEVWDVDSGQRIAGTALYSIQKNWRRIANIISDKIYKDLTAIDGYFDSRIVFVSESGNVKGKKQLALIDQDGANIRYLTSGHQLVSTPRFSHKFDKIAYVQFIGRKPHVFTMNPITLQKRKIGNFPGITFAPRFSPDGKKIILSHAHNGNTDIYEVDLASNRTKRLTRNLAIDTSPSYSPDGTKIVFESDRGGQEGDQQIYVKDLVTESIKRISFGNGRYATPVWSPTGKLIAFTKMHRGSFYIGVMRPDGSGEKILAQSFHVEGPSWSPNGKVITYFQKTKNDKNGNYSSQLFAIDINGLNRRKIPTPRNASDPGWSGHLPH